MVPPLLILAMAIGAVVVWVGIPIAGMWLAGEITDEFGVHMPLAMAMILPGVAVGSIALAWINTLYLRLTEDRERVPGQLWRLHRRGPLEAILFVCFLAALIAISVWFFFFAENPPRGVL